MKQKKLQWNSYLQPYTAYSIYVSWIDRTQTQTEYNKVLYRGFLIVSPPGNTLNG